MKPMAALLWIGVAFMAVLAAVWMFQERLLYFPGRARVEQLESGALRAWPSAHDFRGLLAEPPPGTPAKGTAVVLHGNAGHVGHRAFYARVLAPLGWRVLLAEYPGYGPRDGKPGESALASDAAHTLALVHRQYGGPIVLIGESLGAGVAAAAAVREPKRVDGLLLITPWDRLASVASHHYAWLPVRWMLRDRYDSAVHLAQLGKPVVVVVAEHDSIVPARFGRALHEALGEHARRPLIVIPGSGHNDWPERVDAQWWKEAMEAATAPSMRSHGS
jgi:pimeloyl-ACP methyl ester carboxylesterase